MTSRLYIFNNRNKNKSILKNRKILRKPILGSLLKEGIKIGKVALKEKGTAFEQQKKVLGRLLQKAQFTKFGQAYDFEHILEQLRQSKGRSFYELYQKHVPVYTYNTLFNQWWYRTLRGESNVCWPGRIKYFALSSGTSEAATKHIPVTRSMVRAIQKTGRRQILTLAEYDLPANFFQKSVLMLGGSTDLTFTGTFYEGDLSGIQARLLPYWFQRFYKPGKRIAQTRDWNLKLDKITQKAKDWDIGVIVGVPAWIQLLMEKIIAHYKVESIHDIWPNLRIFTHGGVSFEPYKKGFEQLLSRPLMYMETYLASEGFIAYQAHPNQKSMRLELDNSIFMEFIPFDSQNFDADGELMANPVTLMVDEVTENVDYALLISTCAGTWRYLIGDVIRFVNKAENEIVITGRTKHYISLCGEHLSVENMNQAVSAVADELNIHIKEFAVAGVPHGTLFAHKWFIGSDAEVDTQLLIGKIDDKLKILNDDYRIERLAALKDVSAVVLPTAIFYDFLKKKGKEGGQNKFPRVLKSTMLAEWEAFIETEKIGI